MRISLSHSQCDRYRALTEPAHRGPFTWRFAATQYLPESWANGFVLGKWFRDSQIPTEAAAAIEPIIGRRSRLVFLTRFGMSSRPPSPLFEKALEAFVPISSFVEVRIGPVRKLRVVTISIVVAPTLADPVGRGSLT